MADGKVVIDVVLNDGSVAKGIANIDGIGKSGERAGLGIGKMVTALGLVKVASAALGVVKSSLDGAISRFDTMQKFPKVMAALGFSSEDSSKSIKKLSDGIDGLPTKLNDVVSQTQQLTSITGDLNKSTDTVLALNNAFLASGSSAEDASRGMIQYNQMLSKGTVDMQSWRSLQETMPLGLQKTAEAMGFTGKTAQKDLYAALQDGTVTFDQFNDKLIELGTGTGMLASLAKENSFGIATSFGNLRNAVSKGMANTLNAIDKVVKALTGKSIAQNIDSLKGIINSAFSSINKSIEGSVDLFNSLKTNVTKVFGDIQKAIAGSSIGEALNILKSDFSDFIKSFNFNGLSGAFNSIATTISTLFKSIDFSGLAASFGAFLIGLQQPLAQYGSTLANYWKAIFEKLGPIVSSTLGTVLTQIPALFQALVSAIAPIINQISSMISKLDFSGIQAVLQAIIPAVVSGFKTMMAIVGPSIKQVITSFGNLWNAIQPLLTVLAGALMPAFQVIGSFLGGLFSGILTGVSAAFDVIRVVIQVLTPVISALVSAFQYIAPVLSTIAQWVGYVIGSFIGLGGSGSSLKTILTDAWSGIKNASSVAGNVIGAVVNGINGFFSALSAAGGGLSGALQVVWNAIKAAISVAGSAIGGVISGISGFFSSLISAGNSLGGGMSAVWSAITGTISRASGTINGIINNIKGFFNGLANIDLSGAGAAIIDGFVGGLKGAWEAGKKFIGGIGDWIKEHKGPINYDRKLLIPAGNAIMTGFNKGLKDKFQGVRDTISGVADELSKKMMVGIELGINDNARLPRLAMEGVMSDIALPSVTAESVLSSRVSGIGASNSVTNNYYQTQSNNSMLEALNKLANRPIVTNIDVDSTNVARATSKAMTQQQYYDERTDSRMRGILI